MNKYKMKINRLMRHSNGIQHLSHVNIVWLGVQWLHPGNHVMGGFFFFTQNSSRPAFIHHADSLSCMAHLLYLTACDDSEKAHQCANGVGKIQNKKSKNSATSSWSFKQNHWLICRSLISSTVGANISPLTFSKTLWGALSTRRCSSDDTYAGFSANNLRWTHMSLWQSWSWYIPLGDGSSLLSRIF